METEYARLFSRKIIEPLRNVVGRPLQSVVYYVLCTDFSDFDVNAPIASGGCQGVRLTFEGAEVELDWDWQRAFRPASDDLASPPIAYHLVVRAISERQPTVGAPAEDDVSGLAAIDATQATPWNSVQEECLLGVRVWGVPLPDSRFSPQAVEFFFPSGDVVVTIGMTEPLSITDGDEVLVFTGAEWKQQVVTQPESGFVSLLRFPEHLDDGDVWLYSTEPSFRNNTQDVNP